MNTLISLRSSSSSSKKLTTFASITTTSLKHLLIPSSSAVTTPAPTYHRQFINQSQSFHPKFGFLRSFHGSRLVNVRVSTASTQAPSTIDLVGDSDQKLADGITLYSISSDICDRPSIIGPLITEHANGGKCIVFIPSKRYADRLTHLMQKSFRCEALHGDVSKNQRERTLSGFRDGRFNVLVATDIAACGLDVPNVDLVIHYEPPKSSEIFVHRSGRIDKKGSAILMYSSEQWRDVLVYEREVGCKFTELPPIAVDPASRIELGSGAWISYRFGGRLGGFGSSRGGGGGFGRSSYGGSSGGGFDSD